MAANRTEYERFESSGADQRRLLRQEELILDATETICMVMSENNISRSELAKRLGKSRAFVTQILSGGRNLTLRTLSDVADALDCRTRITMIQRKASARIIHHGTWSSNRFDVVVTTAEQEGSRMARSSGGAA
jgi:transcriptional regulator with XRE-family HTH domain